jgi:hypothetical protein
MKIGFKLIFCFLSLILFSNSTSQVFGQRKFKNKLKTEVVAKKQTDERREKIEILMLQGKYQHDGSGELAYIGRIESVPALLKVLEDNPPHIYHPCAGKNEIEIPPPPPFGNISPPAPPVEVPKPDCLPKKNYICTYAHAIAALMKITGQKFIDYEIWKSWWEKYQAENKTAQN